MEYIHSKGLVVCDIKPSTVAIGDGNTNEILFFTLVFGESYANAFDSNKQRLNAKHIRGTPEYMSVGMLSKLMPVPQDDLISLGIVLMQLNDADIPSMNKATGQIDLFERLDIILNEWKKHPIKVKLKSWILKLVSIKIFNIAYVFQEVCNTTDDPKVFKMYFELVDGSNAYGKPKYDELVKLFSTERSDGWAVFLMKNKE